MDEYWALFLPLLGMLEFIPPMSAGPQTSEVGPASGDGLLLENGTDYLLLESGDFLLLE
jgi:hypothetical protein